MSHTVKIGPTSSLSLFDFKDVVYHGKKVEIDANATPKLKRVRGFIDFILEKNFKVYGITTGFADLRSCSVSPDHASKLSENIILSHDAATGKPFEEEIVLGAMLLRAQSLAIGYSGFQLQSLQTLVDMINCKVIPVIPSIGSLGASGDLATLARLGRAMQGHDVAVVYQEKNMPADVALKKAGIRPFAPKAKEGLALTNGTSFMISMLSIAFLKEMQMLDNIFCQLAFVLNSSLAIDAAFADTLHQARGQKGQTDAARRIRALLEGSPFVDKTGVQQDYCVRCLPQIMGPKLEIILEQLPKITTELNAVTDNPLIFEGEAISSDVSAERRIRYLNTDWAVLSGGNFHGENITTIADLITAANAKIALTLERQITYLLNPQRNGGRLPTYLIAETEKAGLQSGYMITQYTANALAQKIATLALPSQMFNLTSGNESEDVVSYGATACQRLLEQLELMSELNAIHLVCGSQSYGLARRGQEGLSKSLLVEKFFQAVQEESSGIYPTFEEDGFETRYKAAARLLENNTLVKINGDPLLQQTT